MENHYQKGTFESEDGDLNALKCELIASRRQIDALVLENNTSYSNWCPTKQFTNSIEPGAESAPGD